MQFESLLYERNSAPWLWKVSINHLRRLKPPQERNIGSHCCKQQISVDNILSELIQYCAKVLDILRDTLPLQCLLLAPMPMILRLNFWGLTFYTQTLPVCLISQNQSCAMSLNILWSQANFWFQSRFSNNTVEMEILWTDFTNPYSLFSQIFSVSVIFGWATNNIYLFRRLWKQDSVVANDSNRVTKYSWKSCTGTNIKR